MADAVQRDDVQGGLSESEKRANVVRLAFAGDRQKYERFLQEIRKVAPPGTTVVLRGSAVTGERWKDGARFDADGPGTSDLDLTFVGHKALEFFKVTGFFVPGVHSRPLSEEDPDIAPALVPLRRILMDLVGRPVNIQASRDVVLQFRGDLLDQPYLVLLEVPRED
jgi:predicted nucleotidyltransferase